VLLVWRGLLMRSFLRVLDVNSASGRNGQPRCAWIRTRRVFHAGAANAYFDEILRRVQGSPGSESAGLTDALPLGRNRRGERRRKARYPKGKFPARVRAHSERPLRVDDGNSACAGRDISRT
jgi:hypothetical protein